MSIGVVEEFYSETVWYDLQSSDNRYVYSPAGLSNKNVIKVKSYPKNASGFIFVKVSFLNSSGGTISESVTKRMNTGSTNDISEVALDVPAGAVSIALKVDGSSLPTIVSIEYITFSMIAPKIPVKYLTSQNVVITNSASIALLGGGGGGGSVSTGTAASRGGGGSGYLTHATILPGTYSLTIGAGGNNATGGTTSFSTFNALGGGSGSSAGNPGGSAGGGPSSSSSVAFGGFNGNSTPNGTGSGVIANLFAPGLGGASFCAAGGLYAGGAGPNSTANDINGVSAAANTGGGGGGCRGNGANGSGVATGGTGGSGALWVLES